MRVLLLVMMALLVDFAAAPAGSPATDKAALLAFKAAGNSANSLLSGWTDDGEPCAEGSWDSRTSGWIGIMCDKVYPEGRVTVLYMPSAGLLGDISDLAPLTSMRLLSLSGNHGVYGDVISLDDMEDLRQLRLGDTSVTGRLGRGLIWIRNPWGLR